MGSIIAQLFGLITIVSFPVLLIVLWVLEKNTKRPIQNLIKFEQADSIAEKWMERVSEPGTDHVYRPATSVTILVLGDIGRSPRMQFHALSIAEYGGIVDLVGYHESEILPQILSNKLINIVPLDNCPQYLQPKSKLFFFALALIKVLFQTFTTFRALMFMTRSAGFMLVQNPPAIPSLFIAWLVCMIRGSRLVIDWHNLGWTILALKLGPKHLLVRIYKACEMFAGKFASSHIVVSDAMGRLFSRKYSIRSTTFHDRPTGYFSTVLDRNEQLEFLARLPETTDEIASITSGRTKVLISSTSWTADEDFSILLQALTEYSTSAVGSVDMPNLLVIITGKGPQKPHYLAQIDTLTKQGKLKRVTIKTAWLSNQDYGHLLRSATLGICLHTSSSGVDLPMKVVDMFGAGLPVIGWDAYEAWPELVKEGVNGKGFSSAQGLKDLLVDLLRDDGHVLASLREGAMSETTHTWKIEWLKIASMFGLSQVIQ